MFKINLLTRKTLFALLVVVIALAAFPVAGVAAMEGDPPQVDPARLEASYDKLVEWYNKQSEWMGKADTTVTQIQTLIDKATSAGWTRRRSSQRWIPLRRCTRTPGCITRKLEPSFPLTPVLMTTAVSPTRQRPLRHWPHCMRR